MWRRCGYLGTRHEKSNYRSAKYCELWRCSDSLLVHSFLRAVFFQWKKTKWCQLFPGGVSKRVWADERKESFTLNIKDIQSILLHSILMDQLGNLWKPLKTIINVSGRCPGHGRWEQWVVFHQINWNLDRNQSHINRECFDYDTKLAKFIWLRWA